MRLSSILCALCALLLLSSCPDRSSAPQTSAGGNAAQPGLPVPRPLDQQSSGGPAIRITADAALAGALKPLEAGFRKVHSSGWQVTFKERGDLLIDLRQPAGTSAATQAAQVYLTADDEVLDELRKLKLMDEASLRTFAGDRVVIVSRASEKWIPASVFDLGELRFTALGIGDADGTSVGLYAKQSMVSDGAFRKLEDRLKEYPDSQALLSALTTVKDKSVREGERGEIQLAFVFASLAAQTSGVKVVYAVRDDLHDPIRFGAVAAAGHAQDPGVVELLRYLAEDPAIQAQLESYGYLPRSAALAPPKEPQLRAPAAGKPAADAGKPAAPGAKPKPAPK